MRNQELMEQIMLKRESVLDVGEFWKSLSSFANFIYATTIYPFSWYQSLPFEQQEIVLKQLMIICFGAALFIVLAASKKARYKVGRFFSEMFAGVFGKKKKREN